MRSQVFNVQPGSIFPKATIMIVRSITDGLLRELKPFVTDRFRVLCKLKINDTGDQLDAKWNE